MDITQLKYFVAVADQLHFRRAAEKLNVTQSALSQQIAKMEAEYKIELFVRTGRSVQLTALGKFLRKRALKILADMAKLEEDLVAQAQEARVRIGFLEYQNLDIVHRTVHSFSGEDSGVHLELANMNSNEIVEALVAGRIDLGVAHLPIRNGDLQVTSLLRGRWGFVLPVGHRLASQAKIEPEDLSREKLVLFKRDLNTEIYDHFIATLKGAGIKPKIAIHVTQSAQGPKLVSTGAGLFLTASYVVHPLPPGLVFKPYHGMSQEIRLGLVWRKRPSEAIRAVINEVKFHARESQT